MIEGNLVTKKCCQCGVHKPLEEFHHDFTSYDDRRNKCKDCQRHYYAEYRCTHAEAIKSYRMKNAEDIRAYHAEYRRTHADAIKAYRKAYRARVKLP